MSRFKRGDQVLAKIFGGSQVLRRVWEDAGNTVYLCSERQYAALLSGWDAPMPIGFPRGDVAPKK